MYILLKFVNHLSREEMLGKMAELIETLISWGLRTLLGVVAGLQVVRGLVTPVMDSLKRSAIGKTAGTLPGVGNAVNAVTELVLTTAVLVFMDYKEKIIKLLEKMDSRKLKIIYHFVRGIL